MLAQANPMAAAIITDLGQSEPITNPSSAGAAVPRYGVWMHRTPGAPVHVVDTGDDLEGLAARYGVPAVAIPIRHLAGMHRHA